jgi:hypothetical protein
MVVHSYTLDSPDRADGFCSSARSDPATSADGGQGKPKAQTIYARRQINAIGLLAIVSPIDPVDDSSRIHSCNRRHQRHCSQSRAFVVSHRSRIADSRFAPMPMAEFPFWDAATIK